MKVEIKLTQKLVDEIVRDLRRPHQFAAERVGFVMARRGSLSEGGVLILPNRYVAIPDAHYIRDRSVGARIGPEAMKNAMQAVYHGRAHREGIFHVHLHSHSGETAMSGTDARELPALIPGFQSVGPTGSHGILIFSRDHGSAWASLPGEATLRACAAVSVIGAPLGLFIRGMN